MRRHLLITISLIATLSASLPTQAQPVAALVVTGQAVQSGDTTLARLSVDGVEHSGTATAARTATSTTTEASSSGFFSGIGAMIERIVATVSETVSRGVDAIVSLFTSSESAPTTPTPTMPPAQAPTHEPIPDPVVADRQSTTRPVAVAPAPVVQRPEPAPSAPAAASPVPHLTEPTPAPAPAPTGTVRRDVLGYAAVEAGPKVETSELSATLPESGSRTASKDSALRASTSTRDVLGYGAVDIRDTSPDSQTKGNAMVASVPEAAPRATVQEATRTIQAHTESAATHATTTSTTSAAREVYTAPFMDTFVARIEERPTTTTPTTTTTERQTTTTERQAITMEPQPTAERSTETTERTATTTEREAYTAERPTSTEERSTTTEERTAYTEERPTTTEERSTTTEERLTTTEARTTETSERQVATTEPQPTTERQTETTETASRETTTTETASRETPTAETSSTETTTASREPADTTIDCRDPANAKNPSCSADARCVDDAFVQANREICRIDEYHPGTEVAMIEPGEGKRSVTEGSSTFKSKIFDISNLKEIVLPLGRVLRATVLEGKSFSDQVVMFMGIVRGQKAMLILDPFTLKAYMCTLDRSSPYGEPFFAKKGEIPVMSFGEGKVLLNPAEFFRKMLQVRGVELRDVVARACDVDSDLKEFNAVVEAETLPKPAFNDLAATLKEEAKSSVNDEGFGQKLSEQIKDQVVLDAKFKAVTEFGKSPNAMVATDSGSSFYMKDEVGNAVLDTEEILPKGERLVFADQNNFGGPDLFLITHRDGQAVMSLLANQNNPPKIEKVEVTGDNIQLSAVVRTEPGENLVYKWTLQQDVNGQMVDRTAYLNDATVENPVITWPTLQTVPAGDVSINESVAIATPIYKSTGTTTESAHKYVATLTVTDPAGASASGDVSMSMSIASGVAEKGAETAGETGTVAGGDLLVHGEVGPSGTEASPQALSGTKAQSSNAQPVWGFEGGCSLLRQDMAGPAIPVGYFALFFSSTIIMMIFRRRITAKGSR